MGHPQNVKEFFQYAFVLILFLLFAFQPLTAKKTEPDFYSYDSFNTYHYRILSLNAYGTGTAEIIGANRTLNPGANVNEVVIPSEVLNKNTRYSIVAVAEEAFMNRDIETVTLPNGLIRIGKKAFYNCKYLYRISGKDNTLVQIGDEAFSNCTSLSEICPMEHLNTIGKKAFSNCSSLTSFTFSASVNTVSAEAFSKCGRLYSIYISPNDEQAINFGSRVFNGCGIVNVTTSRYFSNSPFAGLTTIKGVYVSSTTVPANAFRSCSNITNLTLHERITSIGDGAFSGCRIKKLDLPKELTIIGKKAFYCCQSINEIIIPNKVTEIKEQAFYGCDNVSNIELGENVTTIGKLAFGANTHLSYVDSNNPVPPTLADDAFNTKVYTTATLLVPQASITDYNSADNWKNFTKCRAMRDKSLRDISVAIEGEGAVEISSEGETFSLSESGSTDAHVGKDVTVTLLPAKGKMVSSASYQLGGKDIISFTSPLTIEALPSDLRIIVVFDNAPIPEPTSIAIEPSDINVDVEGSLQLNVLFEPGDANSLLNWSITSGEDVAIVNRDGVVSGLSEGEAEITVKTANGLTASAKVNVTDNRISIEEIPALHAGQRWQARLRHGLAMVEEGVTWRSSNPTELPVSENGEVTVNIEKSEYVSTTLTASYGGVDYDYTLDVYPINRYSFIGQDGLSYTAGPDLNTVSCGLGDYNLTEDNLTIGNTAADIEGFSYPVTNAYLSLPETLKELTLPETIKGIGVINASGLTTLTVYATEPPVIEIYLNMPLSTKIYVPADAVEDYKTAPEWEDYAIFPINENFDEPSHIAVENITFGESELSLEAGETVTLIATVLPADADNRKVNWKSSDDNIATVDEKGLVTAIAKGFAVITASSDENPEISAKCSVTVTDSSSDNPGEYAEIYSVNFLESDGNITQVADLAPETSVDVWTLTDKYGWKGTAYINNVNHASDCTLLTPEINLSQCTSADFDFEHAVNFVPNPTDCFSVLIFCDENTDNLNSNVVWPAGNKWDFNNSGKIDLSAYAGKVIKIGFRYTSTSSLAGTWEIKSIAVRGLVKNGGAGVNDIQDNDATSVWAENGQLHIRGEAGLPVRIYSSSATLLYSGLLSEEVFSYRPAASSVLIVVVNGKAKKIFIK